MKKALVAAHVGSLLEDSNDVRIFLDRHYALLKRVADAGGLTNKAIAGLIERFALQNKRRREASVATFRAAWRGVVKKKTTASALRRDNHKAKTGFRDAFVTDVNEIAAPTVSGDLPATAPASPESQSAPAEISARRFHESADAAIARLFADHHATLPQMPKYQAH
jgi:hypothetical protein